MDLGFESMQKSMLTHKDSTVATMTYEVGITYCFYLEEKEKCIESSKFDIDNAHGIAPVTILPFPPCCFNLDKGERKQTKLQPWPRETVYSSASCVTLHAL